MEKYFVPVVLALGLILATVLTRWMNWYAWGENRYNKKLKHAQRRAKIESDAARKNKESQ